MPSSEFAPLATGSGGAQRGFAPLTLDAPAEVSDEQSSPEALADAEADAERRRAFETGFAEGRASRDGELAGVYTTLRETLDHLARFRGELRQRYEQELLGVALGVAHKVVRQEVTDHPERWLEMIRAAIGRAVDREHISVRVPPALGAFLREVEPPLRTTVGDVKVLEIVDDPGLPDGGCLLETRFGDVDASLDTQLANCERALRGAEQ